MATAQNTIEEKVLKWPPAQRVKLAERLLASVANFTSPGVEAAWDAEIASRVAEIREGRAEGIPAEKVMKEARRKLNEARRLSPARRRRAH